MSFALSYRAAAPVPRARGSMHRLLFENNPFYLLSAACMLLGLMTLTNSLSFSPIPQLRLIVLIGTLSFYEAVLIGLAVWLIGRQGVTRDAEILLAIEALFIADGAMLGAEMFAADWAIGAIVNLTLLVLATGKLAAVIWALKLDLRRTLPPVILQLALLFFAPGWFKAAADAHRGELSPLVLYGGWSLMAAFPILTWLTWRAASAPIDSNPWEHDRQSQPRRRVAVTFSAMCTFSMVVHLAMSSWVYKVHFWPADLAPLTLGVALVAVIESKRFPKDLTLLRTVRFASLLAIMMSLPAPSPLTMQVGLPVSTLRLALFGAAIIWMLMFAIHRRQRYAIASLSSELLAMLGATFGDIFDSLTWPLRMLAEGGDRVMPTTAAGWGVVSVCGAFVLLIAGAAMSVLKKPREEPALGAVDFSVALNESDTRRESRAAFELAHGPHA